MVSKLPDAITRIALGASGHVPAQLQHLCSADLGSDSRLVSPIGRVEARLVSLGVPLLGPPVERIE